MENKILEFVINYLVLHCYPPTVREIGKGVGLSSSSTVHMYIREMLECGMLETDEASGKSRALRVPGYRIVKTSE